jgi:hypothetical protein
VGWSGKLICLGKWAVLGSGLVWLRSQVREKVWSGYVAWSGKWTSLRGGLVWIWTGLGRRLLWDVDWSGTWPDWTGPGKWADLGNRLVRVRFLVETVDCPGT